MLVYFVQVSLQLSLQVIEISSFEIARYPYCIHPFSIPTLSQLPMTLHVLLIHKSHQSYRIFQSVADQLAILVTVFLLASSWLLKISPSYLRKSQKREKRLLRLFPPKVRHTLIVLLVTVHSYLQPILRYDGRSSQFKPSNLSMVIHQLLSTSL